MAGANYDVVTVDGRTTLWLDSEKIDESLEYYRANHIDFIGVNPVRGYKLRDLEFLRSHPDITGFMVVSPLNFQYDLGPLAALSDLRSLVLPESVPLDLGQFPRLDEFYGVWHAKLDLSTCKALKHLSLRGYKSKTGGLDGLPDLPSLRDLGIIQSTLTSLKDLSRFVKLRRLKLAHLTKLESLDGIQSLLGLERLECEKCGKLKDHQVVHTMKHLQVVSFFDCGTIPTLAFLNEMPALRDFGFVRTTILDGDLTPLLRLKTVGFLKKKGYSHTPEELDALMRPRGGRAIVRDDDPAPEPWRA
jgi:hypothetical protein